MMPRLRSSFIFLCYLLRAKLVASSSPTLPNLLDLPTPDQDNEIAPQPNGGDDSTAKSMLPSEGSPTSLDTQFSQSLSDVQPIPIIIDQPPPPTSNGQSNPLGLSGSADVALENGDAIPFLPSLGGGSENIQIGGPDIFHAIQQNIQQFFQKSSDQHRQPEPRCEPRKIPFGGEEPVKMFAMCCGKVPKTTGPGSCNRLRVERRRNNCYVWPDERCTPGSIHCCHCKNRNRVGFECIPLSANQGVPADTTPNPERLKRDVIPMWRRQDNIATSEPFSPVEIPGHLAPLPATAEESNSGIAMTLGETAVDKPKNGRGGSTPDEWNCSPEFERAQGGTPPKKPDPPPPEVDLMEPPEYEEYREEDECPEESDLKVPDNWSGNDYYWHDH